MAKYLLVSFKTCPWVQRAAIVLREKNTPFEFRHIEPDNRPDWFLAISPHKKVPVLRVDDKVSLFELNAINEYLDETIAPRLHPEDPVARAINRAWTDYVPTFSEHVTGWPMPTTRPPTRRPSTKSRWRSSGSRSALEKQGGGPFFNGAKYSLVDAAYAPFLQRYFFLDRIRPIGQIEKYPRLKAWADTLMKRPSTHSFPAAEFEAMYRENVRRRTNTCRSSSSAEGGGGVARRGPRDNHWRHRLARPGHLEIPGSARASVLEVMAKTPNRSCVRRQHPLVGTRVRPGREWRRGGPVIYHVGNCEAARRQFGGELLFQPPQLRLAARLGAHDDDRLRVRGAHQPPAVRGGTRTPSISTNSAPRRRSLSSTSSTIANSRASSHRREFPGCRTPPAAGRSSSSSRPRRNAPKYRSTAPRHRPRRRTRNTLSAKKMCPLISPASGAAGLGKARLDHECPFASSPAYRRRRRSRRTRPGLDLTSASIGAPGLRRSTSRASMSTIAPQDTPAESTTPMRSPSPSNPCQIAALGGDGLLQLHRIGVMLKRSVYHLFEQHVAARQQLYEARRLPAPSPQSHATVSRW